MSLCGFLNLDKPIGLTSRDVVDLIARPLKKRKIKVGHAGTLDPLASGVLVVAVGSATRLIENVQALPKTYRTVARLGATSDTLDADGRITETIDPIVPNELQIREAIAPQIGTIQQLPPQFSALKVAGKRAYDLARSGQVVELAPRPVRIDRIDLIAYDWPRLELEIDCGSGTYIRSIVRDVGGALGCGALIDVLTRTRIGPFTLADAIDPRAIAPESILDYLHPSSAALDGLPRLTLDPAAVTAILRGQSLPAPPEYENGDVTLIDSEGLLIGIAEVAANRVHPRKVLHGTL